MTQRGAFMHHHYKKGVFGMAKKGWGKFVAFAAVTGAVAAGVTYFSIRHTTGSWKRISGNSRMAARTEPTRTARSAPLMHAAWTAITSLFPPARTNSR